MALGRVSQTECSFTFSLAQIDALHSNRRPNCIYPNRQFKIVKIWTIRRHRIFCWVCPSVVETKRRLLVIHSFISNVFIASLQESYSEVLPTPARLKQS